MTARDCGGEPLMRFPDLLAFFTIQPASFCVFMDAAAINRKTEEERWP